MRSTHKQIFQMQSHTFTHSHIHTSEPKAVPSNFLKKFFNQFLEIVSYFVKNLIFFFALNFFFYSKILLRNFLLKFFFFLVKIRHHWTGCPCSTFLDALGAVCVWMCWWARWVRGRGRWRTVWEDEWTTRMHFCVVNGRRRVRRVRCSFCQASTADQFLGFSTTKKIKVFKSFYYDFFFRNFFSHFVQNSIWNSWK